MPGPSLRTLAILIVIVPAACETPPPRGAPVRLWHTFGADELADVAPDVEATRLLPAHAQHRIAGALAAHPEPSTECPDLIRIDATWLPALAAAGHLRPIINEVKALDGIRPEAVELVEWNQRHWGLPEALEPFAIVADRERVAAAAIAWPPASVDALFEAARALATRDRPGLAVRADGRDVVGFLRAAGGELVDVTGTIDVDVPVTAMTLDRLRAAVVAGTAIAPPDAEGATRAFTERRAALLIASPSALPADLPFAVEVAPWPVAADGRAAAPRGGHVYVVPRCATQPDRAWALATALTTPAREAQRRGVVPTHASVAPTAPIGTGFVAALAATRPLPRQLLTPRLFEDLTPAVRAVLDGEASGAEALAGVARGWRRVFLGASGPSPGEAGRASPLPVTPASLPTEGAP